MKFRFQDEDLERLYSDVDFRSRFSNSVVRGFRKCVNLIQAATDERDFYALKSLHFEKLQGDLAGKHSMRIDLQWRLLVSLEKEGIGKTVLVIEIVDYH